MLLASLALCAQPNVVTNRYNNARTGANIAETILTTANVRTSTFGKLFSYTVDGSVYAQPLYVSGLSIPGNGVHNVVFVVTMNDSVYAFDADNPRAPDGLLWRVNFTNPAAGITPVPIQDITGSNNQNIVGPIGIESTPAIALATNTMYLVARTKENGSYPQRLHALDITTGSEKFGGPVAIQASVPGTGSASVNGVLTFDPKIHNQRAGLAVSKGQVYIAWASHEDDGPYHGWVMTYDASTLARTGVFNTSPNGVQGGIWQSGRAPAIDASGNVYYMVGNGTWDGVTEFGEAFLKLSPNSGLPLLDWFTPDDWNELNAFDIDLGSSGPLLIPGTKFLVGGGKEGVLYLLNTASLGHMQAGNIQIPQFFRSSNGNIKNGPVYWNHPTLGPLLYLWSDFDVLKVYHFNGTTIDTTPAMKGIASNQSNFGPSLTLSANGSRPGTGILWVSVPVKNFAEDGVVSGMLRAFSASDVTKELWNTLQNRTRDDSGLFAKWVPPTVANGKVYMASFESAAGTNCKLTVYGLLPASSDFELTASPASVTTAAGTSAVYTLSIGPKLGYTFSQTASFSVTGLAAGETATFAPVSLTGPGTVTVTVATSASTPAGMSNLTVTAGDGSFSHTVPLTLTVAP